MSNPSVTYAFGDADTPTQMYSNAATVDVNGDGHPDGVYLDFDGSGHPDSIAWDSDGDGKVDTILVSTHHDGVYDTAYYDPSGQGHWDMAEPVPAAVDESPAPPTVVTYAFGDVHTPTHTYSGTANVDVNGDGHPDGVYLDFDGSGHPDAIAWDSDGDGKVDTILVSTHHDGVYDTAYHDPAGSGHWNQADEVPGAAHLGTASMEGAGTAEGLPHHETSHTYELGGGEDVGFSLAALGAPEAAPDHDLPTFDHHG